MGLVGGSAALAHQHLIVTTSHPAPAMAVEPTPAVPAPEPAPAPAALEPTAVASPATDSLLAPVDGVLGAVLIAPGDRVAAGQTVATIVSHDAAAFVRQLATDVERARAETNAIERSITALDDAMAAATTARTNATVVPRSPTEADVQARAALERAQKVYSDAIARERRAAALEAFGVRATQELEEAQVAVRAAAAEVQTLRRAIEADEAAAAAETEQARAQAAARSGELQQQRDQRVNALHEARLRQREAELALTTAKERLSTTVRSRIAGVVSSVAAAPGAAVTMGTPLVAVTADEDVER